MGVLKHIITAHIVLVPALRAPQVTQLYATSRYLICIQLTI